MKILHYINNLCAAGAEKLLIEVLPLMQNKGHAVYLLYCNNKLNVKEHDEILLKAGIKIKNLNVSFYNPLQIFSVINFIRKEKFDIVHAHIFPTQYWLAFASFFIPVNTKLFKTEHSVLNKRRKHALFLSIEKLIYSRYARIIAITNEVKNNLIKWLKAENKIVVINSGINLKKFNTIHIPSQLNEYDFFHKNNFNILMTARFNGVAKDQNTLIHAVKLLPEKYHVYFAGDGKLLENSRRLASELKIENRVHFLGIRTDVIHLMRNIDLNVLSTNYEGLSGVTLESLASGKPFIGSDVPGVNNIVPDNKFLFPVKNPAMLAQKIKAVCENKNLALEMIKVSTEHIKKYDISLMVNEYLKIYASLI